MRDFLIFVFFYVFTQIFITAHDHGVTNLFKKLESDVIPPILVQIFLLYTLFTSIIEMTWSFSKSTSNGANEIEFSFFRGLFSPVFSIL